MLILAISLERAKERNRHIKKHLKEVGLPHQVIEGVDGLKLTGEDLERLTDIEKVKRLRWWLTDGMIGCSLSHLKAYELFLNTDHNYCLILEDDAVLPKNIKGFLSQAEEVMNEDEVLLLYYSSHKPQKISTQKGVKTDLGGIYYPVSKEIHFMSTAGYIIGRKAAEKIKKINMPVTTPPDGWSFFFQKEGFKTLRVAYPHVVRTKNFKSSIDYISKKSWKGKTLDFLDKWKIPGVFHLIKFYRGHKQAKMTKHFQLVNEPSEFLN